MKKVFLIIFFSFVACSPVFSMEAPQPLTMSATGNATFKKEQNSQSCSCTISCTCALTFLNLIKNSYSTTQLKNKVTSNTIDSKLKKD